MGMTIAFFIGLFGGAWFGTGVMACCVVAGRADEQMGCK